MENQEDIITPKLSLPPTVSYAQMHELLSVAAGCIKASNERIARLEARVKELEEMNMLILAKEEEAGEEITP